MGHAGGEIVTVSAPQFSLDFSGSTALVTGASSGLGVRFARVLAACGAQVALCGRRAERLETLAEEIRGAGGTAAAVAADQTDLDAIPDLVERATAALGPVDLLVNNAGVPDGTYAVRLSRQKADQVLATNLAAPFALASAVAQPLIEAGRGGRIVNVASMLAFDYGPTSAAALYATTKAAVVRMTEVLALEWARYGINVNGIAPGLFESEMTDGMLERLGDVDPAAHFPRRRIGKAEDLDSALLFLMSPSSHFVTGTVIRVDDGQGRR
ncbi:MAG: SDR family NAD(P)-dependent oxidoreductase [Pseudomonadota bacterium]